MGYCSTQMLGMTASAIQSVGVSSTSQSDARPSTDPNAQVREPGGKARSLLMRLPEPSLRTQWWLALANLICQIGIMASGATVRVTASGLGCETWPRCNGDSFVPVPGAAPWIHQIIEFGNRTLTFVLTAVSIALLLAVLRAGRRKHLKMLAWIMPFGILAQGIVGGITVLAGLLWWTVAIHLIPSLALVWFASMLFARIREDDDEPVRRTVGTPLRLLTLLSGVALAAVLVTGTLVTGAGPHAGDARVGAHERLQIDIDLLAHIHGELMLAYLALVIGLLFALYAVGAERLVKRRAIYLAIGVLGQGLIGIVQYWMGVPELLVIAHVAGAGIVTALTGMLWASGRSRGAAPVSATAD